MAKARDDRRPAADLPRRRDSPDPDVEIFASEMRDVVRLEPDARGRVRARPRITTTTTTTPAKPVSVPADDALDSFTVAGVDRREIRKLKRGDYVVAGRCDLHGMTAVQACAEVGRFLERSRDGGHRCICIVHGRGLHSAGGTPVLKARVRTFLAAHRAVLAYADAPPADGGPGAVYVLLRR